MIYLLQREINKAGSCLLWIDPAGIFFFTLNSKGEPRSFWICHGDSGRRSRERKGRGGVVFGDHKQHWLRFGLHALLLCRMSPYCCLLLLVQAFWLWPQTSGSQSYLCPMQVQELQTCGLAVALSPQKMLGVWVQHLYIWEARRHWARLQISPMLCWCACCAATCSAKQAREIVSLRKEQLFLCVFVLVCVHVCNCSQIAVCMQVFVMHLREGERHR